MKKRKNGKVIIPAEANPWPHEIRVAKILAQAGHVVEFIPENQLGTPDIYLDGVRYEIKSPFSNKPNTLERRLKEAIRKQSHNIIFDSSRIKNMPDYQVRAWLRNRCRMQPQIKKMIFVDKGGEVIDIKAEI